MNKKDGFIKYNKIISILLITIISLFAVMPFLGCLKKAWWVFDIFIHFKIHYIYGLILSGIIAFFFRKFLITALAFIFAVFNLLILNPFPYLSSKKADYQVFGESKRAMFANINMHKKNPGRYISQINNLNPDILIFVELTPLTYKFFKEKLVQYSYSNYSDINEEEPLNGIAMFSKIKPLDDIKIIHFGKGTCPSVQITFMINEKIISVIGTHPFSPINKNRALGRDKQLLELSNYIKNLSMPVLLIGDLNSTIWQPEFKALLSNAEFINSMEEFGMQGSWPASLPAFLRITIDHVLHSRQILLKNKFKALAMGSDHFPIVVDFSVK